MKTLGLAAMILVLAGTSIVAAQETPKPAPAVEPESKPRSVLPPLTPAEKKMRQFRNIDDSRRYGPVEIFSPLPAEPDIDVIEAPRSSPQPAVKSPN